MAARTDALASSVRLFGVKTSFVLGRPRLSSEEWSRAATRRDYGNGASPLERASVRGDGR